MATLMRDTRALEYDIIAIQEPWRNPFVEATHYLAKDVFYLCYPPNDAKGRPARVCFFINKRLDYTR